MIQVKREGEKEGSVLRGVQESQSLIPSEKAKQACERTVETELASAFRARRVVPDSLRSRHPACRPGWLADILLHHLSPNSEAQEPVLHAFN